MLANVKKRWVMDNVQKQRVTKEVSALYGSLAFMYARHLNMGLKEPESLTPTYLVQIEAIFAYVEEMGYQDILK